MFIFKSPDHFSLTLTVVCQLFFDPVTHFAHRRLVKNDNKCIDTTLNAIRVFSLHALILLIC